MLVFNEIVKNYFLKLPYFSTLLPTFVYFSISWYREMMSTYLIFVLIVMEYYSVYLYYFVSIVSFIILKSYFSRHWNWTWDLYVKGLFTIILWKLCFLNKLYWGINVLFKLAYGLLFHIDVLNWFLCRFFQKLWV